MTWWQTRKRDADVERELQSDLELEEEEQREHGVSPEEARHAAMRAFGSPTLICGQLALSGVGTGLRISFAIYGSASALSPGHLVFNLRRTGNDVVHRRDDIAVHGGAGSPAQNASPQRSQSAGEDL